MACTILADISTLCCHIGMGATTVRAYCFAITPTLLGNGLLANVLRVEVVCNLNE
jgi:hypothetical protein